MLCIWHNFVTNFTPVSRLTEYNEFKLMSNVDSVDWELILVTYVDNTYKGQDTINRKHNVMTIFDKISKQNYRSLCCKSFKMTRIILYVTRVIDYSFFVIDHSFYIIRSTEGSTSNHKRIFLFKANSKVEKRGNTYSWELWILKFKKLQEKILKLSHSVIIIITFVFKVLPKT